MTIKEAWAALEARHWWSLRALDDNDIENVVDERIAARALAVETFWRWRCCHKPCTRDKACDSCAESAAEIEALGR